MPTRRDIARWGLATFIPGFAGAAAHAAAYPEQPIKIIVGFPAGQTSDASARRVAQNMGVLLKQSVFVDNRPGAGGSISHGAAKTAAPDGYTLVMGSTATLAINPTLYRKLPYDPLTDFEPVSLVAASPLVMVVAAASPVASLKDLVARAKAQPGKLTYGSAGNGATGHIAMEMLKKETGTDIVHVPYKGSPAMVTDLAGGQIDVALEPIGSVLPLAKGGRVRIIGIAALKRHAALPEVATLGEQGLAGFEATPWSAILAPKGTPAPIVQQLNAAVNHALKDPAYQQELAQQGSYALGGSPADFRKFLLEEHARWGRAVKASGAQID